MSTANFGVFYTQAGGGGILPTDLAYTDRDNEFSAEQTFLDGVAIQGQATCNADATTADGLVRLSQAQDLIVTAIAGFSADGNTWDAPQVFDAKAQFNAGALFQNVAPQSSVDVTGSVDTTVIPNKAYVDNAVADAVGVKTDVENDWTAQQNFEAVVNANGGISSPFPQNNILGGDGQRAISSDPEEYYHEMGASPFAIDPATGVSTVLYTKRTNTGDAFFNVLLPDVTTAFYGKRLLIVATVMLMKVKGDYIQTSDGLYTEAILPLGASLSLVAMFLGANSGWYVYGHEGTITYS